MFMNFLFSLFLFSLNPVEKFTSSIVYIEAYKNRYDYTRPWQDARHTKSSGTGFIIKNQKDLYIITNAHIVSDAFQIQVKRNSQSSFFVARVVYISHESDLALLDIDTQFSRREEFYRNAKPLEIGETPELNTPVLVMGYPIGGKRLSLSKGIVSRIDFDVYSHSGLDKHLVIQVDAAINPGNSGGPAIQNGKVVGIAFQTLRSGENLGYLIPPPVIKKFLRDIRLDGKYDGYVELGVFTQTTENPVMKKALNLPEAFQKYGLYVYDVLLDSSAYGVIKPGDVILEIQGNKITETGEIRKNGELIDFVDVVDTLEQGEIIRTKIFRDSQILDLKFPAKITGMMDFLRKSYDYPPEFLMFGGFLFQPLDANLFQTYSQNWMELQRSEIFYLFHFAFQNQEAFYNTRKILLTGIIPYEGNEEYKKFLHRFLKEVNGRTFRNLKELHTILKEEIQKEKFIIFRFENEPLPLVLETEYLKRANTNIERLYRLPKTYYYRE